MDYKGSLSRALGSHTRPVWAVLQHPVELLVDLGLLVRRKQGVELCQALGANRGHLSLQSRHVLSDLVDLVCRTALHGRSQGGALIPELRRQIFRLCAVILEDRLCLALLVRGAQSKDLAAK